MPLEQFYLQVAYQVLLVSTYFGLLERAKRQPTILQYLQYVGYCVYKIKEVEEVLNNNT